MFVSVRSLYIRCVAVAIFFFAGCRLLALEQVPLDMYGTVYWNSLKLAYSQNAIDAKKVILNEKSIKKRLCILYGNCQAAVIGRFLQETYPNDYEYVHVFNWRVINGTDPYPQDKFKKADVFIHQPIKDHGKCDTAYIKNKVLKKECLFLSFPYIYFSGYFPDHFQDSNNPKTVSAEFPVGAFPDGHQTIAYYILQGLSADEVINKSLEDNFLSEEFILKKANESLNILREHEKITNVKIADFIEANFAKFKCFHTVNHPANQVFKEVLRQLLPLLKYDTNKIDSHPMFNTELMQVYAPIIYPCVAKDLRLQFDTQGATFWGQEISYASFIREYMRRLYPQYYR